MQSDVLPVLQSSMFRDVCLYPVIKVNHTVLIDAILLACKVRLIPSACLADGDVGLMISPSVSVKFPVTVATSALSSAVSSDRDVPSGDNTTAAGATSSSVNLHDQIKRVLVQMGRGQLPRLPWCTPRDVYSRHLIHIVQARPSQSGVISRGSC